MMTIIIFYGILILISIFVTIIIYIKLFLYFGKETIKLRKLSNKHLQIAILMDKWLELYQNGVSLCDYFKESGHKSVSIYGFGYVGMRLYNELIIGNMSVEFIIDKRKKNLSGVNIINPNSKLPDSEIIIVTAIQEYDDIELMLSKKTSAEIKSIEEIIEILLCKNIKNNR